MAKRSKGGWDGQDAAGSTLVFPKATGDPWDRIASQAKRDMLHKGRLYWAVESMIREQAWTAPAHIEAPFGSETTCDYCGRLAVYAWERTAKDLKRMAGPKVKGSKSQAAPVSHRCAVHVPVIFPELGENYRDARVSLSVAA